MLSVIMGSVELSFIILSDILLSVTMLSTVMGSVMLSFIILSDIMFSVVMKMVGAPYFKALGLPMGLIL
jgi:hypothetical protein